MKKQLTILAAVLATAALTGGTVVSAKAAVRELILADSLITDTGILNEVDWVVPDSDSYRTDAGGSRIRLKDVIWGSGYIQPYNKVNFSKGDAVFEFDVLSRKSGSLCPLINTGLTVSYAAIWIQDGLIDASADPAVVARLEFYSDYECTTAYPSVAAGTGAWFNAFPNVGKNGKHIKFIYKADGTLGIETYLINDDGTYTANEAIYIKNAYVDMDATQEQYVGVRTFDSMDIDNLKVSNGTEVVYETDCTGTDWVNTDGVASPNKVLLMGTGMSVVKESALEIIEPADTERIVSEEKVVIDENISAAFVLSGAIKVKDLGGNFGFAFGLSEQDTAISESSFVYLYNKEGITYIASNKTGDEVSLEKDLTTTDEYVEFKVSGTKEGKVTVVLGGVTAEFTGMDVEGYVAVATEGKVNVALDKDTKLTGYKYRASSGGEIANNFNTGYINGENWTLTTGKATHFENLDDAEGLVVEDGELFFKGTTFGAWFGTVESYADYVVEFDYTSIALKDRPAVEEGWATGYSSLIVILGGRSGSGWGNGLHCEMREREDKVYFHNFISSPAVYTSSDDTFDFSAGQDADKTISFKFVVANNNVKIYVQDITENEFNKEQYTLLCETDVADTYGTVAIATDDCGYFKIDNLRITPMDDPDAAVVAEKIASYQDKQPIADEYRPYELEMPELTLTGNVVSWDAVEGATGYRVTVNGAEKDVQTSTSYTVNETAEGDYVISVKAIGNGEYIYDSEESETVMYTVGGSSASSGDSVSSSTGESSSEDSGCGSVALGGWLIGLGVTAVCVFKKKNRD